MALETLQEVFRIIVWRVVIEDVYVFITVGRQDFTAVEVVDRTGHTQERHARADLFAHEG